MSDIKLNDKQIEVLKDLFSRGYRWLFETREGIHAHTYLEIFEGCIQTDLGRLIDREKIDFFDASKPFYFGDLFEVVYKGV